MAKLLTKRQTAEQLNVSLSTLRNWDKVGKGPKMLKLGPRTHRYAQEEVAKYLAELETVSQRTQAGVTR